MENNLNLNYSEFLTSLINVAIWEWDLHNDKIKFNEHWAKIIGYSRQELELIDLEKWKKIIHPDDLWKSNIQLKHVLLKEDFFDNVEIRLLHKDGHWVYVLTSGRIVKWDENGNPLIAIGTYVDITNKKMVEIENKRNIQLLKEIIDNTKDIIYRTDEEGKLVFVSDAIKVTLGYDKNIALGRFVQRFIHPDDLAKFKEYFLKRLLKSSEEQYVTFRLKHADQSWHYFETISSPLFEDDIFVGYVGAARDVTSVQRMNQLLKEQRMEMERFFKVNVDLFCILDKNGTIKKLNKAWETTLGYPLEHLIGQNIVSLIHEEDVADTKQMIGKIISDQYSARCITKRYRKADGTYCYLEWNANPYGDLLYASARDISIRIAVQKQLIAEKEHFRTTLMSVGDGIIVTDQKGIITDINNIASKLTGYSYEEAIGTYVDEIFVIYEELSKKHISKIVETVITNKDNTKFSGVLLSTKIGKAILIDNSFSLIIDYKQNVRGVVIAFRDVSESKEHQRKIEYLSYHDQLTKLYNRHYLDRIQKNINKKANYPLSVISLDLNDLKLINDNYGHHAGDQALKRTAKAITKHVGKLGYSFRIGGDEFLVFMPCINEKKAKKITKAISEELGKQNLYDHTLSIAIGVSVIDHDSSDLYTGIKRADDTMYLNKSKQKGNVDFTTNP